MPSGPPQHFAVRIAGLTLLGLVCFVSSAFLPGDAAARPLDPASYPAPIRVACVGASITQGHGATPGMSYPDQLQRILGGKWKVSNFGVSGTTMMRAGKQPYWNEAACRAAHDLQPDAVVILLGTNDTKPWIWKNHAEYVADCRAFIESFKTLPSHPQVFLCRLPPVVAPGNYGINPANLQAELALIDQVGKDEGVDVVDVYSALLPHPALFVDRIHPNNAGAAIIAHTVARALTGQDSGEAVIPPAVPTGSASAAHS
jgi:lysophospholipase L1-like esterase